MVQQNVIGSECTFSFRSKEYVRISILSLGYGSLYSVSSLSILRITALLVFLSRAVLTFGSLNNVPFVSIQSYNIQWYQSAYVLATRLYSSMAAGLSLAVRGFSLILKGRLTGTPGNRSMAAGLDALSVAGSRSSRILDLGYEACITSLGVLGVKVGLVS